MLCPNCGKELAEEEVLCPNCGTALPAQMPEDTAPAPEADSPVSPEAAPVVSPEAAPEPQETEDETAEPGEVPPLEEEGEAQTAPETEDTAPEVDEEVEPEQPKKKSPLGIVVGAIAALLVIIVVCLAYALSYAVSNEGSLPSVSSLASTLKDATYDEDAIAATLTDESGTVLQELTNNQLSFYYWGEYYYYVNNYGFSFDASLPLDEQTYQEDTDSETGETTITTWEDYFLDNARYSMNQTLALKAQAEAEGFTLPEDYQEEYDSVIEALPTNAASAGFTDDEGEGDVLSYIRDSYGDTATLEDFEAYLYASYLASAYSDSLYYGFTYTDSDYENYYAENADYLELYGITQSDTPNVNVRHILVTPESDDEGNISDEAWEAAEAEAQRILEEWQSGEATEESFGTLAETYSTDTGSSSNGGLYEDVYPGEMVTNFNDWCFDASRQPGDTGIVQTDYGYHIMYFVSQTDTYYWKTVVENELRYEDYNNYTAELMERYIVTLTSKAAVRDPDAVKAIQESYASDTTDDTAVG